ncbi:hypothetical protein SAMN05878276_3720 [Aquipseudomonas alcaligenes]|jgi:hypothetical protein|nr:hypothetical protein SAMN05878276_3720 [Pseudomonas alcaligenes]
MTMYVARMPSGNTSELAHPGLHPGYESEAAL